MKHSPLAYFVALSLMSAISLCAQDVTVLESFEDNIDAASPMTWGGRPDLDPPGVTLTQYTATGADDPFVTDGQKSLKVTLSGNEGWGADFEIALSDEASALVREAVQTGDVAQYILRWDYIFPPEGSTAWMNSQIQEFGGNSDELDSNNGRVTMSIPLDLLTDALPEDGPLLLQFAQNFDATEDPFVSLDVYVDNVRLVNTYAPRATPKIYVLQSFEDAGNPTGGVTNFTGWGGGTRTTYEQYTATGAGDIHVSHGTHALQVNYSGVGAWDSDFLVPFNDTMLAEVLKLDLPAEERPTPAELARYTLRWDVTYPEQATDWTDTWMNTSYDTQEGGLPWSLTGAFNTRRTYSITLDQFAWADWATPAPSFMVIANGAWGPSGTTNWFDNFVLIDTGDTSSMPPPQITGYHFDTASDQFTLTWGSTAGDTATYAVARATDPAGAWTTIAENLPGQGASTSYTDSTPPAGLALYRVIAFPPPALFEAGFEPNEDLSGWSEVVTMGESQWEVGAPTTGPGSAHTGVNVLATKLAGDYGLNQEVGYRSPVIDLTGVQAATLQFYTYYEFEPVDAEGIPFDWGDVNLLDAATGQNLLPGGAAALHYQGAFKNWRRVSYALPPEALGKNIRVEFKLISDVFSTMPGWYIDDLRID